MAERLFEVDILSKDKKMLMNNRMGIFNIKQLRYFYPKIKFISKMILYEQRSYKFVDDKNCSLVIKRIT